MNRLRHNIIPTVGVLLHSEGAATAPERHATYRLPSLLGPDHDHISALQRKESLHYLLRLCRGKAAFPHILLHSQSESCAWKKSDTYPPSALVHVETLAA